MSFPTVDWRKFGDFIAPAVPGCPKPTIIRATRNAAIQLCEKARIWHYRSIATPLVAGRDLYAFAPPAGTEVCGVKRVFIKGKTIAPCTDAAWPYERRTAGTPQLWKIEEPGAVKLWPIPDADAEAALEVIVTLAPADDSLSCPTFLYSNYRNVIAYGARAELMLMPNCAWSDLQMSAVAYDKFESGIAEARVKETTGRTGESLSVQLRPFV